MKVLIPKKGWSKEVRCPECDTCLLVEHNDLMFYNKKEDIGHDIIMSKNIYYVKCQICSKKINIEYVDLPDDYKSGKVPLRYNDVKEEEEVI